MAKRSGAITKSAVIRLVLVFGSSIMALGGLTTFSACGIGEDEAELKQVEAPYVCMVNNRLYDKEQIEVKIGELTYYGCCERCKKALWEEPALRLAEDPFTGKTVDKATAVIGALSDGSVYYFESQESMERFHAVHDHSGDS